jgi:hypothetical protein
LSCNLCNRPLKNRDTGQTLGKHNHFPLVDEAHRAFAPTDAITRESPYLLDPGNDADTTLLWFDPDGRATFRYPDRPFASEKARISIEVYNLNHVDLTEGRLAISNRVKQLVRDGNRYLDEYLSGNLTAGYGFGRTIQALRQMLDNQAEYSSAARAMLMGLRDSRWVETVFIGM